MAQIDIIPTLEIPPVKIDMERLYNIALDSRNLRVLHDDDTYFTNEGEEE